MALCCTAAQSASFYQATVSLGQRHETADKISAIFIQHPDDLRVFHRGGMDQFFAFLQVFFFSQAYCILEPWEFDPTCLPSDLKENFTTSINLMQVFRSVLRCVLKYPDSYSAGRL